MRATLLLALWGCSSKDPGPRVGDTGLYDDTGGPGGGEGGGGGDSGGGDTPALEGWIGSPCESDADCPYDGAACLGEEQGFPGGACSLACDSTCPDEDGYPVTACIDPGELPDSVDGGGSCLSRCDFSLYPGAGCRDGYGCARTGRADADLADVYACTPGAEMDIGDCRVSLVARGIGFEPAVWEDDSPEDAPELTCHVEDPVWLISPIKGVDLRYVEESEPTRTLVDCETAHAIADTAADVGPLGAWEIIHYGTYNCRTISGSDSLSMHGLGRALDVYGFTLDDGSVITVIDHWEDGDDSPESWEGQFLYDAVHRWYDAWIWNIILTPEYNEAHDNHFHVDLTDGSHSLYGPPARYLGPMPAGWSD